MLARWQFGVLTGLGALALALVAASAFLFVDNRAATAALAQRQQYVQQSIALESLYGDIVRALAESGMRGNDRQVLGLLAAQGLNVTLNPPATAPSAQRAEAPASVAPNAKR